jgi:coenzyme F420-reducing hydrogenase beta subunit
MFIEHSKNSMDYNKQTIRLRQLARDLLSEGTVQVVVGFRENLEAGAPSPLFARSPEDAEQLVLTGDSWRNLAPYLLQIREKAAIAAKPCDVRAIINLLAENQLKRDNIVIIGIECCGIYKERDWQKD